MGDIEARGGQCSLSRATHTPRVLPSSGFLLRVLLAHMHCAIFQLGEGGVLGWTVCPGQGASLKPLGTAQPYFLRAECALTRTSCPLSIWSEQLVGTECVLTTSEWMALSGQALCCPRCRTDQIWESELLPLHPFPRYLALNTSPYPDIHLLVWEMGVSQRMAAIPSGLRGTSDEEMTSVSLWAQSCLCLHLCQDHTQSFVPSQDRWLQKGKVCYVL